MTLTELAALIPAEYRREILLTNMINNAQPVEGNNSMFTLFTYWKTYIEPDISYTCNKCYVKVLDGFKQMLNSFIELEKQSELLKEV